MVALGEVQRIRITVDPNSGKLEVELTYSGEKEGETWDGELLCHEDFEHVFGVKLEVKIEHIPEPEPNPLKVRAE